MIMPAEPQPEVGNEKLTKKFFMRLPAAIFLTSNLFDSSLRSVFAEYVLPLTEREKQWLRICAAGANQRKCRIFKDQAAFQQWLNDHSPHSRF